MNFTTLAAGLLYCYWYCLTIGIIFVIFEKSTLFSAPAGDTISV